MAEMLRLDMHVHSHASFDSLSRPEDVLRAARKRGMNRLVIADHNRVDGAQELYALDPERILIGEEVKTAGGVDVIGILLRERIPKGTGAAETCERIREQGGVVYIPHPFDVRRAGGGELLEELEPWIDVVEAHNARCWWPGLNARGEAWAKERGKLLGAGSDAHTPGEIGHGWVEVPPFEPTREGLLGALAAGTVGGRATFSPLCHLRSSYAKVRKKLGGM